jgi:glutamine cyclotransferase
MSIAKVDVRGTDAEDYTFTLEWTDEAGAAFDFANYEIEYTVVDKNGTEKFTLTQDNSGVITDDDQGTVTFDGGHSPLVPGKYVNHCRIKVLLSGQYVTVFAGEVTIQDGGF